MNILFDLSATQSDNEIINHGGSEYAKAVFIKLIESGPKSVTVFYNRNLNLEKTISELIKTNSISTLENNDILSICRFVIENNINVFYSALPKIEYIPLIKLQSESFKVIITIHGLRSLELPSDSYEWFYCHSIKSKIKFIYKQLFPSVYRNSILKQFRKYLGAYRIITVSNYSKYSLLTFFPELADEKVTVLYSPLLIYSDMDTVGDDPMNSIPVSPKKYFLVISGSIWIKNSYRAIKAFDNLILSNPLCKDYKMIISGLNKTTFKVKNQENFVFLDYVSRNTLEYLFKNSLALVYPSLNEGFGYPPLEAMKYGVPVLTSGIGPMPEVCGNAAYYFNPKSEMEIKIRLFNAISDSDIFSISNRQSRYDRYMLIRERQENDLDNMIKILLQN